MKDEVHFSDVAKQDLLRIESSIDSKYHEHFFGRLASFLCKVLREPAFKKHKQYRLKIKEKSIPGLSEITVNVQIRDYHHTPAKDYLRVNHISIV